jgi:hypothetical protein
MAPPTRSGSGRSGNAATRPSRSRPARRPRSSSRTCSPTFVEGSGGQPRSRSRSRSRRSLVSCVRVGVGRATAARGRRSHGRALALGAQWTPARVLPRLPAIADHRAARRPVQGREASRARGARPGARERRAETRDRSRVDLASGRLHVADSKTDAGRRTVDLSPDLRDELLAHKANAGDVDTAGFVFATRNDTARQRSNLSRQILRPAILAANEARVKGRAVGDQVRRDEPQPAEDLREPALRGRRLARLRDVADGARELGARARGLREGDGTEARRWRPDGRARPRR